MLTALAILVIAVGAAGIGIWCLKRWVLSHDVDWRRKLEEPIIIAALVAGITTGISAIATAVGNMVSSAMTASAQKAAEIEKLRVTTVLDILQKYEPTMVPGRNEANQKQRMTILIQSGIIPDHDGRICMALIKEGCPIKVLKAPK